MRVVIYLLTGILLSLSMTSLVGQNVANNEYVATSANSISTIDNLQNGTTSSSINLGYVDLDGGASLPVNLSYSGGNGIPVNQYHSNVGLGWNISGHLKITSSIRGRSDLYSKGGNTFWMGLYYNDYDLSENFDQYLSLGHADGQPDIYSVNLLDQTISFYYNAQNNEWKTIPEDQNIDIQVTAPQGDYLYNVDAFGFRSFSIMAQSSSFIITDHKGYVYHFGGEDHITFSNSYNKINSETVSVSLDVLPTQWHCTKIITPYANQEVNFTYEDEVYTYRSSISTEQYVIENSTSKPNDTYYQSYDGADRFTYTYSIDKRLSNINYLTQDIEFVSSSRNTAFASVGLKEPKMLNTIRFKSNNERINSFRFGYRTVVGSGAEIDDTGYDADRDIFLLDELKEYGGLNSSGNDQWGHLFYDFKYYNDTDIPRRLSASQDYWGYYNGASNESLIPSIYTEYDRRLYPRFGDRKANSIVSLNGLLKSIKNPHGGKTSYEYEPNKVKTNNIKTETLYEYTGNINYTTEHYFIDCPDEELEIEEYVNFSTYEFIVVENNNEILKADRLGGYSPCQFEAEYQLWTLYKVDNNSEVKVSKGSELNNTIDLRILTPGSYKLIYASNNTTELIHLQYLAGTNHMEGGGVRLKRKIVSDEDDDSSDDIITNYDYSIGEWGYDFLPSIEAKFDANYNISVSDPLIPAINDGPADNPKFQYVISTLSQSPYSAFVSLVYYDTITISLTGIPGYTKNIYTVPNDLKQNGECSFLYNDGNSPSRFNNRATFINGGLKEYLANGDNLSDAICYDNSTSVLSNGRLLSSTVYRENEDQSGDPIYSEIESTHYEYEDIIPSIEFHIEGKICKRYVQDQAFNYSWDMTSEEYIDLCQPYSINIGNNRLLRETKTIDGITVIKDFTYSINSGYTSNIKRIDQHVVGMESDILSTELDYVFEQSSTIDWIQEMSNRNMQLVILGKKVLRNGVIVSGKKTDFKLLNMFAGKPMIAKHIMYNAAGGSLRIESRVSEWDDWARIIKLHKALEGCSITDDTDSNNYEEVTTDTEHFPNSMKIKKMSIGDRHTNYTFNSTGDINSIQDYNGNIRTLFYDPLGRTSKILDGNLIETEYKYYNNRVQNYSTLFTFLRYPNDSTIDDVKETSIYDGLGRPVEEKRNSYPVNGADIVKKRLKYNSAGLVKETYTPISGTVQTVFDNSPLQRKIKNTYTSIDGESFEKNIYYGSNKSEIIIAGQNTNKSYPAHTLHIVTMIDEFGNTAKEYTDINGLVVRKEKINNGQSIITDFYYNVFGQLLCQSPPTGEKFIYTYQTSGYDNAPVSRLDSYISPGEQEPTTLIYDRHGRIVLTTNALTTTCTIYDKYGQSTHHGTYIGTFPSETNTVLDADIPLSEIQLLESTVYDGEYNESEYPNSITTSYVNHLDEVIDSKSSTKTFVHDSYGRPKQINFTNHRGQDEQIENTYNTAGMLTKTEHYHTVNGSENHTFIWESIYDEKLRNIQSKLNGQVLTTVTYDDFNRKSTKSYHKYGNSHSDHLITDTYKYDGFGRLNEINDLSIINADNSRIIYCNQEFDLNTINVIYPNTRIEYIDNDGNPQFVSQIPANFQLVIESETSRNLLLSFIESFLITEGYVFDDLYFKNKQLVITQTNSSIFKFHYSNDNFIELHSSNCCPNFPLSQLFAQEIIYDKSLVKENHWSSLEDIINTYQYHYDDTGRLLAANHSDRLSYEEYSVGDHDLGFDNDFYDHSNYYTTQTSKYSTSYAYDDLSQITGLTRRGKFSGGSQLYGVIDKLNYAYNLEASNNISSASHLSTISDISGRHEGFYGTEISEISLDDGSQSQEIGTARLSYDAFGNVISHTGDYINGTLSYNRINHPARIIGAEQEMRIEYNAGGQILNKTVYDAAGVLEYSSDFIGNIEYRNEKPFALHHGDGRILLDPEGFNLIKDYEYDIKDYKGETRVRFSAKNHDNDITFNDIISVKDYYPFGMEWDTEFTSKELYNHKGYQQMHHVSEFDLLLSKYRILDPQIGKWLQIDPESPQFPFSSPYTSMGNNPVMYDDKNGDFIQLLLVVAVIAYDTAKLRNNLRAHNKELYTEWGGTLESSGVWAKFVAQKIISLALDYVFPFKSNLFPGNKIYGDFLDRLIEGAIKNTFMSAVNFGLDAVASQSVPQEQDMKAEMFNREGWAIVKHSISQAAVATLLDIRAVAKMKKSAKTDGGIMKKNLLSHPRRIGFHGWKEKLAQRTIWNPFYKGDEYTTLMKWQYGAQIGQSAWQLYMIGSSGWAYREEVSGEVYYGAHYGNNEKGGAFDPNFSYTSNWDDMQNVNTYINLVFSIFRAL